MPALTMSEAAEKLAKVVELSKPSALAQIYAELFPEKTSSTPPLASDLARHIRHGLAAEEVVDLWNVVFPEDHHVWYDDEANELHYNEEMVGYAED